MITEAVHTTPYPHAPNIVIAYPGALDWRRVYRPAGGSMISRYKQMRGNHETEVTDTLDEIVTRAAGRAMLADIRKRPDFSVMILPFDFQPPEFGHTTDIATTMPIVVPVIEGETVDPRTRPENAAGLKGRPGGLNADRFGTGSAVDLYFTVARGDARDPADETLLHELLHASRLMKGLFYTFPLRGGYGNMEEFFANVIENIYRSEKGGSPRDYGGRPINPDVFLDERLGVDIRSMLGVLRGQQPALFQELAAIRTAFNPVAQVAAEEAKRKRRTDLRPPAGAHPLPHP